MRASSGCVAAVVSAALVISRAARGKPAPQDRDQRHSAEQRERQPQFTRDKACRIKPAATIARPAARQAASASPWAASTLSAPAPATAKAAEPGRMPTSVVQRKVMKGTPASAGARLTSQNGKHRHEAQEQQIGGRILPEAAENFRQRPARLAHQRIPSAVRAIRKTRQAPSVCRDNHGKRADDRAKKQAAEHRQHQCSGHGERNRRDIDHHIGDEREALMRPRRRPSGWRDARPAHQRRGSDAPR